MANKQDKQGKGGSRADQVRSAPEGSTAGERRSRADTVRSAVEQAFEATAHGAGPVRERAQELADELVGAASKFREVFEELRPPTVDELSALREEVASLEARVAALEAAKATPAPRKPRASAPKPRTPTAKPTPGAGPPA